MVDHLTIPIRIVHKERWGNLSVFGDKHEFCGEDIRQKKDISFTGGHRVRLYVAKKNVHWKIPERVELDISGVAPARAPRRRPRR